jgi:hypothetical protein
VTVLQQGRVTWRFGRAGSGASDASLAYGPCASAGNSELGWAQSKLGWCDIRATPCCVHITQLFHQHQTGLPGGWATNSTMIRRRAPALRIGDDGRTDN